MRVCVCVCVSVCVCDGVTVCECVCVCVCVRVSVAYMLENLCNNVESLLLLLQCGVPEFPTSLLTVFGEGIL